MKGRGVGLAELALEALANLRGQGRRSVLALLGVVIGSASIVALMNIAHIAQLEAMKSFRQTGVEVLSVQSEGAGAFDPLLTEALVRQDQFAVMAAPFAVTSLDAFAGEKASSVMAVGVTPAIVDMAGLTISAGRMLREVDDCSSVAVLGQKVAVDLSVPGAAVGPGSVVHLGAYGFTVVGTLTAVPPQALSPIQFDSAVLIPLACARRILPGDGATGAMIRLRPEADTAAAVARYTAALSTPQAPVRVQDAKTMIEAMKKQMAMLGGILVAIGSISLLVGGVGVMNVMLMTVMERRREIGLRAAIGATPGEIRMMFLIEAVVLALGGGLLGDGLGVGMTWLATLFLPFDFAVSWTVLLLGAGVATGVGLVFGLYPAIAASRIQPIEALRGG
ncbi:ABC transporter permease [uncultured Brevundimonas sp.]|uniref:ABC transporter permease n=1 Tax=uncultured Brevundimonas sp. TaxID=213418 RepID=UPI0025D0905B|nr:ABC transporter permease [uncultured Brevundimonas sp.]